MMEMPLSMLPVGTKGKITELYGGRGLIRRLSSMGFAPGTEVTVIHSHASHNPRHGGPLVVEVKDSRIVLGRGVAMKIMVQEVKS
jgi:ferrous iron transport protein A